MKDDDDRLDQVAASLNTLATTPRLHDWTAIVNAILARMSVADKLRLSQGMHIGWRTSTKILRSYARACTLAKAALGNPMAGVLRNCAKATRDSLAGWTGSDGAKLIAAKAELNKVLNDHAPKTFAANRFDYQRPVCPGLSYSHGDHGGPGTIGCFVRSRGDGQIYGLSNEHIMKNDTTGLKTTARLILAPAFFNGGGFHYVIGEYVRGLKDNLMDAALFKLDVNVNWSNTTPDGRVIAGHAEPVDGEVVSKYGCRTLRNDGRITKLGLNAGGYLNQMEITGPVGFQSNGDSGSILVNANNEVVGLMHMGGDAMMTGLCTPIQRILDYFEVDIA